MHVSVASLTGNMGGGGAIGSLNPVNMVAEPGSAIPRDETRDGVDIGKLAAEMFDIGTPKGDVRDEVGIRILEAKIDNLGNTMQKIWEILERNVDTKRENAVPSDSGASGNRENWKVTSQGIYGKPGVGNQENQRSGDGEIGKEKIQLKKMEEEEKKDGKQDEDEISLEDGIKAKLVMRGRVQRWFVDKGYGFNPVFQ